jgi:hypothetical protein
MAATDAVTNGAKSLGNAGMNVVSKTGSWLVTQFTTKLPRTISFGVAAVAGAAVLGLVAAGIPATTATLTTAKGGLMAAWEGTKTVGGAAWAKAQAIDWSSVGHSLSEAAAPIASHA